MCKNSVLESESISQRIVIYRTRRFIGEELILAIGDFSGNSPILNTPILIKRKNDKWIYRQRQRDRVRDRQKQVRGRKGERDRNMQRQRQEKRERERGKKTFRSKDRQMKKLFTSKCENYFCKNEQTASHVAKLRTVYWVYF